MVTDPLHVSQAVVMMMMSHNQSHHTTTPICLALCHSLLHFTYKPVASDGKQDLVLSVVQTVCKACLSDKGCPFHSSGRTSALGAFLQS